VADDIIRAMQERERALASGRLITTALADVRQAVRDGRLLSMRRSWYQVNRWKRVRPIPRA
jgi:hypothetical protein